jgi:dienelactone hydrolase
MRNRKILFAICLVAASSVRANAQLDRPAPSGEYGVGRRSEVWTDSSRRDPVDTTRSREIAVVIWYPADVRVRTAANPVLPDEWQDLRVQALETRFGSEMGSAMQGLRSFASQGAELARRQREFPVLVFTPGLGWLASDYSIIAEDLASHGYVVFGISSPGFADPLVFPDGRVVKRSLGIGEKIGTDQQYVHQDAFFVLDEIRKLAGNGFFKDRLDLNQVGAFGHSLGGTTSFVLANRDSMVRGAVNIDGDAMGDVREVRPTQPLLLISSQVPRVEDSPGMPAERAQLFREGIERSEKRRTAEWDSIASRSSSAHRVRIAGTQHLDFTDAALASDRLQSKQQRWMKFGSIEPKRALLVTGELVRSFFDQLFGRAQKDGQFTTLQQRFPELGIE